MHHDTLENMEENHIFLSMTGFFQNIWHNLGAQKGASKNSLDEFCGLTLAQFLSHSLFSTCHILHILFFVQMDMEETTDNDEHHTVDGRNPVPPGIH